jgi:hypothetical protein
MRDVVAALGVLVLMAPALADGRHQDEASRPTFHSGITLATVSATVRGPDERLLTDLGRDEFRIAVDGRPVAIDVFDVQRLPLQMVLLFGAVFRSLDRVREAGLALIDAMDSPDAATIGSYSLGVALSPLHTGDRQVLRRVLREELWFESGRNPIGAGVDRAIDVVSRASGRRAIVVVGPDLRQLCVGSLRVAPNQPPIGGQWLVDAGSLEDVESLLRTDPFWIEGLRADYEILYWSWAFADRAVAI